MKATLDILYEDKCFIVCYKPAGIPVETRKISTNDMVSILKNYRIQKNEDPDIYLIHRLDQPVEGIIIFGKTKKAASDLCKQFANYCIDKYYLAVVDATVTKERDYLEDYLLKDRKLNVSNVVKKGTKDAKIARLSYRLISVFDGKSLLAIHLETGRHHQIRVQLSNAGYPLYGDKKYNKKINEDYIPIALCSVMIKIKHPCSGKDMEFSVFPRGEIFHNFRINQNVNDILFT